MKGRVLGYNPSQKTGVITGEDGRRYKFSEDNWESPEMPTVNVGVDFEIIDGHAVEIYHTNISSSNDSQQVGEKNRFTAGILAILLGALGIHKFYLGHTGLGILMLVLCIIFIWTWFVPFVLTLIGVIEGIIYLTKTDEQFYETYELNRKAWF